MTQLAFTPDGQFLLSASEDSTLRIWQAATGQLVQTVGLEDGRQIALALAPDSRTFAIHTAAYRLRLGQIGTGLLPYQFGALSNTLPDYIQLRSITFASDGRTLLVQKVVWRADSPYSVVNDLRLEVWRVADGTLQSAFTLPAPGPYPDEPAMTAFSTAAGWLFITPSKTGQRVLNAEGNPIYQLATTPPFAFLSQNRIMVTGSPSGKGLLFWRTGTWTQVAQMDPGPPGRWAFSPDGQLMGCDCPDGTFQLWQAPPLPPLVP